MTDPADDSSAVSMPSSSPLEQPRLWWAGNDDVWSIVNGLFLLAVSLLATIVASDGQSKPVNPLKSWIAVPSTWSHRPWDAFVSDKQESLVVPVLSAGLLLAGLFAVGVGAMGTKVSRFLFAFAGVFALATIAQVMTEQAVIRYYNLEYALWALLLGLIISNTIGTPDWLRPALRTEYYIKTGLVLLGAEVLIHQLLALGLPGIFVAWVVTPIVLITTFWFGQRVLKIESPSLNMVISADMSVCGVSAAIATAAACKAKKEELSLAIGISLLFTVVMMIVLPAVIRALGISEIVGGAWLGGTIDATGAVAAAGAMLGDKALAVASAVKMIQNILIGFVAFGVAVYWVYYVEGDRNQTRPQVSEIWRRFPKFVLGFIAVSIAFSCLHAWSDRGAALADATIKGGSKTLRNWCFCLAFTSIGLETNFRQLASCLRNGKPVVLYAVGQSFNLALTLLMSWLMFEIVFPQAADVLASH